MHRRLCALALATLVATPTLALAVDRASPSYLAGRSMGRVVAIGVLVYVTYRVVMRLVAGPASDNAKRRRRRRN